MDKAEGVIFFLKKPFNFAYLMLNTYFQDPGKEMGII